MSIGVNKSTLNILVKSTITVGLTSGSMMITAIGYYILGCIVGLFIFPHQHEHEYACACGEPPIMTETEATIVGVIFMIGLMIGLFYILHQLKFSKTERIITLIILLFVNLYVCGGVKEILSTQVTG